MEFTALNIGLGLAVIVLLLVVVLLRIQINNHQDDIINLNTDLTYIKDSKETLEETFKGNISSIKNSHNMELAYKNRVISYQDYLLKYLAKHKDKVISTKELGKVNLSLVVDKEGKYKSTQIFKQEPLHLDFVIPTQGTTTSLRRHLHLINTGSIPNQTEINELLKQLEYES